MKKFISIVLAVILCVPVSVCGAAEGETWRSVLYPEDWEPGYTTEDGMFLQDYSYAGYHMGEKVLPDTAIGSVYDVTDYGADSTGNEYSTDAIQAAIDAVQSAGGGTVYVPEGIFKVRPEAGNNYALKITSDNILIKGAGIDKTKIYNDEPFMRGVSVMLFAPDNFTTWAELGENDPIPLRSDVSEGAFVIPVESTAGYNVGDWIMVRNDVTASFIAEHNQTGRWNTDLQPIMYYRQITKIDPDMLTVTIDIPIRYTLKTRDNARISKLPLKHMTEVGVQDISFGMLENLKSGLGEENYNTEGTAAYETHLANFVKMLHVVNGWIKNVGSFRPVQNTKNIHTLSGGVYLCYSRGITVTDCSMQLSLYEGGGGNGYLFNLKGQECLVKNCYAYHGRHNYSFGGLYCSGNVLTSSVTVKAARETDMHMHLTHANLLDNMTVDGDQLEGINRNSYGSTNKHGHSATQVVFWNTYGKTYQSGESSIVETQQYGMGYAIGTRGAAAKIKAYEGDNTSPLDFKEGEGMSDTLEPQSLYADQFTKRLARMGAPQIEKTIPEQGGRLYKNSDVKIIFGLDMDLEAVKNKENVTVFPEADYELNYNSGDRTLTISFPYALTENTEYTVTLKEGGVKSLENTALLSDKTLKFLASPVSVQADSMRLFVGSDFAYADAAVVNLTSEPINALLIIGLYKDDKLIDIKAAHSELRPCVPTGLDTQKITVFGDSGEYYCKAFLWDCDTLTEILPCEYRAGDDLSSVILNPADDAYIRSGGSYNNNNYGTESSIAIKNGTSGYYRKGYMKFDLGGRQGPVRKAVLRLYGYASSAVSSTIKICSVDNNTWLEDKITWNNAPAMGAQLGTMSYTGEGEYCEIDITDYINDNMGGLVSLGIDTSSKDFLSICSREAEDNKPQLVLEY